MRSTFFLLLALLHSIYVFSAPAPLPHPAPYIITQYVEISTVHTAKAYTVKLPHSTTTIPESIFEYKSTVQPTGTPTNGLRTFTDSTSYAEITVVEIVLPPGSVPEATPDDADLRSYVVPVTYTPRSTCSMYSQTWKFVTNVPVSLPYSLRSALTPMSVSSSAATYKNYDDKLIQTTQQFAILNPTDVPSEALASASSNYEPYGISICYTPTPVCYKHASTATEPVSCTTIFDYPGPGSPSNLNYRDDFDANVLRTAILLLCLVPALWILILFLLGFLESWLSFKGIMLGKQRKRGVPYSWSCISCCFCSLCCLGPAYKAKSKEEQAILQARWAEMGVGEKWKLWRKWGFRWTYPDVLGEEPELHRKALRDRCL